MNDVLSDIKRKSIKRKRKGITTSSTGVGLLLCGLVVSNSFLAFCVPFLIGGGFLTTCIGLGSVIAEHFFPKIEDDDMQGIITIHEEIHLLRMKMSEIESTISDLSTEVKETMIGISPSRFGATQKDNQEK